MTVNLPNPLFPSPPRRPFRASSLHRSDGIRGAENREALLEQIPQISPYARLLQQRKQAKRILADPLVHLETLCYENWDAFRYLRGFVRQIDFSGRDARVMHLRFTSEESVVCTAIMIWPNQGGRSLDPKKPNGYSDSFQVFRGSEPEGGQVP